MKRPLRQIVASLLLVVLQLVSLQGADAPLQRIDPNGARGSLVIAGGGSLPPEVIDHFISKAGGDEARLVIIPTASARADDPALAEELLAAWKARPHASLQLLHTRNREEADSEKFVKPLMEATGAWLMGGQQQRIADAYVGTRFEKELLGLLDRGGIIGGSSAGAAIQSKLMIASGKTEAVISTGFDLLPGTVIDQHFSQRDRIGRLKGVVDKYPGQLGLGIDESTALLVQGRLLRVVGEGSVTLCLGKTDQHQAEQIVHKAGQLLDLTSMRRLARDRNYGPFPTSEPEPPVLKRGSLVIVGGGGMPADVVSRFIELAGEVNSSMPQYVINRLGEFLNEQSKPIRGSKICILGMAYKKDVDDNRESPSAELMKLLLNRSAEVTYNDPHIPSMPRMRHYDLPAMESQELTPQFLAAQDCVLIATDHSAYDYHFIVEHSQMVVDTRNATKLVTINRQKIHKA